MTEGGATGREISPGRKRGLELALVGVAAIWGATFVTVKQAVARIPVFEFLALRYLLAAVLVTAIFWRELRGLGRSGLWAGGVTGLVVFAGYTAQTVGLQHTKASEAGFVTGLFVVIAPVLATIVLKRAPSVGNVAGVILATVGLALLALRHGLQPSYGDTIVLGAAVAFAVHIVLLARFSPRFPTGALTAVQMWAVAIAAGAMTLSTETPVAPTATNVWRGILITGVLASALGFLIQTTAQRFVSPTRTAVILASEPAFAGLFGVVVLGESLTLRGWIGAGLILIGMLVSELSPERSREG